MIIQAELFISFLPEQKGPVTGLMTLWWNRLSLRSRKVACVWGVARARAHTGTPDWLLAFTYWFVGLLLISQSHPDNWILASQALEAQKVCSDT